MAAAAINPDWSTSYPTLSSAKIDLACELKVGWNFVDYCTLLVLEYYEGVRVHAWFNCDVRGFWEEALKLPTNHI